MGRNPTNVKSLVGFFIWRELINPKHLSYFNTLN